MEGEKTMKKGVFYSVGVGPGDPELITLKAVRTLERCPVVAAPQTKNGEMLALSIARQAVSLEGKTVVPLHFTMSRDKAQQHAAHHAEDGRVRANAEREGDEHVVVRHLVGRAQLDVPVLEGRLDEAEGGGAVLVAGFHG